MSILKGCFNEQRLLVLVDSNILFPVCVPLYVSIICSVLIAGALGKKIVSLPIRQPQNSLTVSDLK